MDTRIGTDHTAPRHASKPGPKNQRHENDDGIQREPTSEQNGGDEIRFQQVKQQIPSRRQKGLPKCIEGEKPDSLLNFVAVGDGGKVPPQARAGL